MGATLALLALPLGVAVPAVAAPAPTSIVAASHATAVTPSAVSRVVSGAVSSAAATAAPGVARGDDPTTAPLAAQRAGVLAAGAAAPRSMPDWFTGPRLDGIDVSAWDGPVSWSAHRAKGVSFAWVKATEGKAWRSSTFATQYAGAARHGVLRGAYHFARPANSGGVTQARFFVRNGGAWRADGRTLPGALDLEMPPSGDDCYGMSPAALRAWIGDFTREYRRLTGRNAIIYTTNYWWRTCTGNTTAFAATHRLWLARYSTTPGTIPGGWARPSVWQYSGDVMDKNVWFGSAASLRVGPRLTAAAGAPEAPVSAGSAA